MICLNPEAKGCQRQNMARQSLCIVCSVMDAEEKGMRKGERRGTEARMGVFLMEIAKYTILIFPPSQVSQTLLSPLLDWPAIAIQQSDQLEQTAEARSARRGPPDGLRAPHGKASLFPVSQPRLTKHNWFPGVAPSGPLNFPLRTKRVQRGGGAVLTKLLVRG